MKTLEQLFGDGHRLVRSKDPLRHMTQCPNASGEEGPWWIKAEAVPAVAMRHMVEEEDLAGQLDEAAAKQEVWRVQEDLCWCTKCTMNRKLLETHDE